MPLYRVHIAGFSTLVLEYYCTQQPRYEHARIEPCYFYSNARGLG
jgi:hypothetical protein